MLRHVLRRLIQMIPLLIGITILSFLIIQLSPGDFLAEIRLNPVVSQETVDQMRANFGLDRPLHIQYLRWLGNIVRGDFGYSFAFQVPDHRLAHRHPDRDPRRDAPIFAER
jgi:peptide/nickel transport system permease protein